MAPFDRDEWGEVIVQSREVMMAYAQSLTHNVEAARDLTQEAILHALSKRLRYIERGRLNPWLCRIVHNLWVNGLRREQRRCEAYSLSAFAHDPFSGEDFERENNGSLGVAGTQTAAVLERDLRRCLRLLPQEQAEVVFLVGFDGMSYEKVAAVLGIPVGTVRSRLGRARAEIRAFLAHASQREVA